jgi:hypothetical protein
LKQREAKAMKDSNGNEMNDFAKYFKKKMLGMLNNQNGTILNFKDVNQLQINQ